MLIKFTLIYDQYDCGDQIDHFNHMCYILKFGSYAIKDYFKHQLECPQLFVIVLNVLIFFQSQIIVRNWTSDQKAAWPTHKHLNNFGINNN